jgi:hypothetical protein
MMRHHMDQAAEIRGRLVPEDEHAEGEGSK